MGPDTSFDLKVTLHAHGRAHQCNVADLAPRGVYLLSEVQMRKHQLVRLTLDLPSGDRIFAHGMVEWVMERDEGEVGVDPGFAVQFYGMGKSALEEWEKLERSWSEERDGEAPRLDTVSEARVEESETVFADDAGDDPSLAIRPLSPEQERTLLSAVDELHEKKGGDSNPEVVGDGADQVLGVSEESSPALETRSCEEDVEGGRPGWYDPRSGRAPLAKNGLTVFRLRLKSLDTLQKLAKNALVKGAISLRTTTPRPFESPVVVRIVHPTFEREFHIPGRIGPALPVEGVMVNFIGVTEKTRECFESFIHSPDVADEMVSGAASRDGDLSSYLVLIERGARSEKMARFEENTEEIALADIESAIELAADDPVS